jgi:hypothetical protein
MFAITRSFPSLDAFSADDRRRRSGLGDLHRQREGHATVSGRRDSLRWFLDRLGGLRPVAA